MTNTIAERRELDFAIKGRCKKCCHTRFAPVPSQNREEIEELFRGIRDYYCQMGEHYDLDNSFLDGYEWDFDHIEPQGPEYRRYVEMLGRMKH